MAGRKPKKEGRAKPAAAVATGSVGAFNAPFSELGGVLRKRAAKTPPPPPPPPPIAPAASPPAPRPLSAIQAFAEATQGVLRLREKPRRVRSIAPAAAISDVDRIAAARREDLQDLAGAVGFDVSFHDHYVRGRADGVSRETLSSLEKGHFAVSAHLDLHGMVLEAARIAVDAFLKEQQRRGMRCVLLVTGKGKNSPGQQGVLREKVPEWLARGPSSRRVLAFVSARPCDGGVGALYVLMRRTSSRKNRIDVEFGGVGTLDP